eukprot:COSAG04_NODE_2660_length_3773_cov_1.565052_4_plen_85_part_00
MSAREEGATRALTWDQPTTAPPCRPRLTTGLPTPRALRFLPLNPGEQEFTSTESDRSRAFGFFHMPSPYGVGRPFTSRHAQCAD